MTRQTAACFHLFGVCVSEAYTDCCCVPPCCVHTAVAQTALSYVSHKLLRVRVRVNHVPTHHAAASAAVQHLCTLLFYASLQVTVEVKHVCASFTRRATTYHAECGVHSSSTGVPSYYVLFTTRLVHTECVPHHHCRRLLCVVHYSMSQATPHSCAAVIQEPGTG